MVSSPYEQSGESTDSSTTNKAGNSMQPSLILIVDDQPEILELIAATLRFGNFQIETAATGLEALERANQELPALIILDVSFPEPPDGIEVCRRLKTGALTQDVPVVMLTSYREAEMRKAAEEAGASAFLTKPFSPLELINMVRRLLG